MAALFLFHNSHFYAQLTFCYYHRAPPPLDGHKIREKSLKITQKLGRRLTAIFFTYFAGAERIISAAL